MAADPDTSSKSKTCFEERLSKIVKHKPAETLE